MFQVIETGNTPDPTSDPENVLRGLVETELTARESTDITTKLKPAAFPVPKTLKSFEVALSAIQTQIVDYLASPLLADN